MQRPKKTNIVLVLSILDKDPCHSSQLELIHVTFLFLEENFLEDLIIRYHQVDTVAIATFHQQQFLSICNAVVSGLLVFSRKGGHLKPKKKSCFLKAT